MSPDDLLARLERELYHGLTPGEYADKLEKEGRKRNGR